MAAEFFAEVFLICNLYTIQVEMQVAWKYFPKIAPGIRGLQKNYHNCSESFGVKTWTQRTPYDNNCFLGEALEAGFNQLAWKRVKNTSGWLHPVNCSTDCIFCHPIEGWHSRCRFTDRNLTSSMRASSMVAIFLLTST